MIKEHTDPADFLWGLSLHAVLLQLEGLFGRSIH